MEASYLEITRDIIQLIFTPLMLLFIAGYQYFKIKNLKDQLAGHNRILGSIQTYFEILDPEVLKYRVEMYEKILEEKKSIEIDKLESKLKARLNKTRTAHLQSIGTIMSATRALSASLVFVPHSQRIIIINGMEDELLKGTFKEGLERYKQTDIEIKNTMARHLLGGGLDPT